MSPEIIDIIQRSLDAVEERLRGEIAVDELAAEAGFSRSRYEHVFSAATGMSFGRYVTRRRLLHAAWAMRQGASAIDAALLWGFDTHAGFYKAFRREFGCAPRQYLRTHRAARPARVNLKEETRMIDLKDASRALTAWGLDDAPAPVYHANTGNRSDNTLAVGEQYYMKISTRPGELARLAQLHRALEKQGLSAPVIPTAAGEDVLQAEGFDCMLLARAAGKPADAQALLRQPETAFALGEGLARLHAALRDCDASLCTAED